MLFAMPSRNFSLSQHFAKAPQIMLWDSQTDAKQIIEIPKSSACCGHKKYWNKVMQDHKVDAIIVRQIGTNMLSALFKLNIRVLSAPRQFDSEVIDIGKLTPVTRIEFARPSVKRNKSKCSGHNEGYSTSTDISQPSSQSRLSEANKLSPRAMKHLNKVLKLTTRAE